MTLAQADRPLRIAELVRQAEDALAALSLVVMAVLPGLEMVLRLMIGEGIPGSVGYVQNLALWVGFSGALVATREGQHLSLGSGGWRWASPRTALTASMVRNIASTTVCVGLAVAATRFVASDMVDPLRLGGWLPLWCVEAILPGSFALMAVRFILQETDAVARLCVLAMVSLLVAAAWLLGPVPQDLVAPILIGLAILALAGTPIFVAIGGATLVLFASEGIPVAAIAVETYRLVDSLAIPSIPLFTLAGFLLAEGSASRRLVELFHALFGWLPGGIVIAATLTSAFFTAFTGASGVGILALGGLLMPILLRAGLSQRTSLGFVTSTGSIGLLFPPSLAVILYGVVAHVAIPDLFVAGLVPGLLMLAAVIILGNTMDRSRLRRPAFDIGRLRQALWQAKWELLLPVVVLGTLFGGLSTIVEGAAITVAYLLGVEVLVHRELRLSTDLPAILLRCATMVGGVFAILGIALSLSSYLVDAQIPMHAAGWVRRTIESPWVFLLALNLFLLVVGCLIDIFSAIVIVVPLLLPLAELYGIRPLHLAMIFLVNLELGYLTPPVGMNLFLSAYRFKRTMREVVASVLPFAAVLLAVVGAITYLPWLIIGL